MARRPPAAPAAGSSRGLITIIASPVRAAGVAHTIIVSAKAMHLHDRERKHRRDFSCLIIDLRTNGRHQQFQGLNLVRLLLVGLILKSTQNEL